MESNEISIIPQLRKLRYGKRPMWQWVLIYLILGTIIYGVIYYLVFANKSGYG